MKHFNEPHIRQGRVAFGLAVMALGLLFTVERFGLIRPDAVRAFWPILPVAYGLSRIIWPPRRGAEVGGMWIALVGGLLLLDATRVTPFEESWPVLIILAGLTVVFKALGWLPSHQHRSGRRLVRHGAYDGDGR
jgi:hypothetical protein